MTPTNAIPDTSVALRTALGPGFALAGPSDYVLRTIAVGPHAHLGVAVRPHS